MTNKQENKLFWALQIAIILVVPFADFLLNLIGV